MIDDLSNLFPFLKKNKGTVYLDSAGTSLKPKIVIKAINNYYQKYSINSHSDSNNFLFDKVWKNIQETRRIIAQRINCQWEEIFFTPSFTYGLNVLALSLKNYLQPGDKIILTHLEHSSNVYPWQAVAQEKKAIIDFLPLDEKNTIDVSKLKNFIDKKTKIVSFTHVSNSLGIVNPVAKIAKKIKELNPNCLIIIDACQSIAHLTIDVKDWGIDALAFSGHKVYGPTGIGVLWLKKELGEKLPDVLWGGGKKNGPLSHNNNHSSLAQKFEVGTLPMGQIFGLKKSFEFLNSFEIKKINSHEKELKNYALRKLKEIQEIVIYNENLETISIIAFNIRDYHAHDVISYLAKKNILLRAGNFCCPYLDKLIKTSAALRISFGLHNKHADIDELILQLRRIIQKPQVLLPF